MLNFLRNQCRSSQRSPLTLNLGRKQGRSPDSSTEIRVGGAGHLGTTETAQTQRAQKDRAPACRASSLASSTSKPSTKQSSAFHSDLRTNYNPGAFFFVCLFV